MRIHKINFITKDKRSWHCNVAMTAVDAGAPHKEANEWAAQFMKNAFGVNTRDQIEEKTSITLSSDEPDSAAKVMGVFRKCGITGFKKPKIGGTASVKMCCCTDKYPHVFIKFESKDNDFVYQAFKNGKENYKYDKLTRPIKDLNKFLEQLLKIRQLKEYHSKIKEYLTNDK